MNNKQISVVLKDVRFPYKVQGFNTNENIYVDYAGFITEYEAMCYIDNMKKKFPLLILRLVKIYGVVS